MAIEEGLAMGLFGRKKKDKPLRGRDALRFGESANDYWYAFPGFGLMMRFMSDEQLEEFKHGLPGLLARECGVAAERMRVVYAEEWVPKDMGFVQSMNADGTSAFADQEHELIHSYLDKHDLYGHQVGDILLMGILDDEGSLSMMTEQELKASGQKVNAAQILFTTWLAIPNQ
jgi:hypothetical protein